MLARRKLVLSLLIAGAVLVTSAACTDSSNTVAGPASMASVNVSGTWTGTFHSGSGGCSAAPMTATLTQTGARVTGTVITPNCGLSSGYLKATIDGNQLTGTIGMMGCTGGAVNGTVSASQIAFSMGDLTKPLVTGDKVISPGGDASLSK
ncbi:MAG TPA: hypothetical protein VH854_07100 [Thermoanaerobaculia bacterium]|jgi:hypothetical protein|nr:hypothetical protein [Thermoanaerobaculia bacterium]